MKSSEQYAALQNVYMTALSSGNCIHGVDCPVCRAQREANDIARQIKEKEYKERCKKYIELFKRRFNKEN